MTSTLEQEIAIAEAEFEFKKRQQPSTISDVAQSIPQYGESFASSALGFPGDVAKVIGKGIEGLGNLGEWAAEQTIGPGQFVGAKPDYSKAVGSADIQAKFDEQFGPQYQPQTPIGQGLNTAARLAPSVLGGPGSLAAKTVTRAAVPAAGIEAIKASPLPEGVKPWAEGAVVLLSPFAANKAVGSTLNLLKRNELMKATGKLPDDIDSLIPSRLSGGTIPTIKQIESARDALTGIAKIATGPQKQQALAAAAEMTKRLEAMEVVDRYVKVKSLTYTNAQTVKDQLGKLSDAVREGKHAGVFTPQQVAQLEKAAQGTIPAQIVKGVSAAQPLSIRGGAGGALLAHIAQWVEPDLQKLVIAGVPWAVGTAAKATYPHMTKNQINRFVASIRQGRGRDVPGAPQFTPAPVTPPSYSPLTPGMAVNPFVDEEQ